ncbi:ATP-binding protein [Hyphomonas sp. WL0036]|uniref:AlbA family DNA-binding domain-containing protein n=1 Tax=Hyphomonas sediminis TaxID=2866160 RepID=UPI001C7E80D1|nr:ATP-binding protein [Hyphomonas sediminis]MBY9068237.1 ATP-binding protein [Hyphomonas sediminis]
MENDTGAQFLTAIQSQEISEDQTFEFKARIELDSRHQKADFINDIVAFLNSGPGHLFVGVRESKGVFSGWQPIKQNWDAFHRQILSIIQDNITPVPHAVRVNCIELDGDGYIARIDLPDHRNRPYQNKLTGGFYIRTGAKNTPIPRDRVHSFFTQIETLEKDTADLIESENQALEARGLIDLRATSLQIAVVPLEHYERDQAPFDPGSQPLKSMRHYHSERSGVFRGCQNGVELIERTFSGDVISRFFIGDDWLLHSCALHPIKLFEGGGRLGLHEFHTELLRHLRDIQLILDDSKIFGPFGLQLRLKNLRSAPGMSNAFPNADTASLPRPVRVERLDDENVLRRFYLKVRTISLYGSP